MKQVKRIMKQVRRIDEHFVANDRPYTGQLDSIVYDTMIDNTETWCINMATGHACLITMLCWRTV